MLPSNKHNNTQNEMIICLSFTVPPSLSLVSRFCPARVLLWLTSVKKHQANMTWFKWSHSRALVLLIKYILYAIIVLLSLSHSHSHSIPLTVSMAHDSTFTYWERKILLNSLDRRTIVFHIGNCFIFNTWLNKFAVCYSIFTIDSPRPSTPYLVSPKKTGLIRIYSLTQTTPSIRGLKLNYYNT